MLSGINIPIRIGNANVMPGDVTRRAEGTTGAYQAEAEQVKGVQLRRRLRRSIDIAVAVLTFTSVASGQVGVATIPAGVAPLVPDRAEAFIFRQELYWCVKWGRSTSAGGRAKRHGRPPRKPSPPGDEAGCGGGTGGGCWRFGASSWLPIPIPSRRPWCSTIPR